MCPIYRVLAHIDPDTMRLFFTQRWARTCQFAALVIFLVWSSQSKILMFYVLTLERNSSTVACHAKYKQLWIFTNNRLPIMYKVSQSPKVVSHSNQHQLNIAQIKLNKQLISHVLYSVFFRCNIKHSASEHLIGTMWTILWLSLSK